MYGVSSKTRISLGSTHRTNAADSAADTMVSHRPSGTGLQESDRPAMNRVTSAATAARLTMVQAIAVRPETRWARRWSMSSRCAMSSRTRTARRRG